MFLARVIIDKQVRELNEWKISSDKIIVDFKFSEKTIKTRRLYISRTHIPHQLKQIKWDTIRSTRSKPNSPEHHTFQENLQNLYITKHLTNPNVNMHSIHATCIDNGLQHNRLPYMDKDTGTLDI